ncbi:MAG: pyruvate formate lyase family protein [Candidatus Binatia bacterium]
MTQPSAAPHWVGLTPVDTPPLPSAELEVSERVRALHEEVRSARLTVSAERAVLVSRYFRRRANRTKPMVLQKAEALAHVLRHKRVRIHPRELLVGCFTPHRVGGELYPELHGVAMLEDLFRFERRRVNPFAVSAHERRQLLFEVLPFWLTRFMAMRVRPVSKALRFVAEQLNPAFYLINETAGISHFVPGYAALLSQGTDGLRRQAAMRSENEPPDSPAVLFLRAVQMVCAGLEDFADGYRLAAQRQAREEPDEQRRLELEHIAAVCARVPRFPARTLHEALQALVFAQIALNLESLDNSVSPGRLDQVLWPYYQRDRLDGRLDCEAAFELLGCYAVKLCELVPVFSGRATRFHGGLFNGQVVVVGGMDRQGKDVTNELTYLFLQVMDRLRTRQPNYHARIHRGSPPAYRACIAAALGAGSASPALYNDEIIVPMLRARGMCEADARDYATVGCVEPVAAGKSFLSTDAALFNLPLCLELALNQGRRFGYRRRIGAATPVAEDCRSTEDLIGLFHVQLEFAVGRLLADLRLIEEANARWHPTPLTSMLIDGCIATARDATAGGALYNGSGIQAVGVVDVGDSLAAVEAVIFGARRATMAELIRACRTGFHGHDILRARLRKAPKYGNDDPAADDCVARAMELFSKCLAGRFNTRGGEYAAGFYSVTAHQAFGEVVGALPSGRLAGAPFSSGLSPGNGVDRMGPTAVLRSVAGLPLHLARNGVNFNLKLDPWVVTGASGTQRLQELIDGGFAAGCMQLQVNVFDPQILIEARDHPGRYPGLLVRVSGYSAYFDDLSPEMKQEIIDRTLHSSAGAACTRHGR